MSIEKLWQLFKLNFKIIIVIGLLLGSLSFLFLIVSQKNFRSQSEILITQNQKGFSDYYALSKSTDYISSILIKSVYSEKFINELEISGLKTSQFLPLEKTKRLEKWGKIVRIEKNSNVGTISVKVFSDNYEEARSISEAIIKTLAEKHSIFIGEGPSIDVRLLSGPLTEKNPSFGQIFLALFGGILAGGFIAFLYIIQKTTQNKNNQTNFSQNREEVQYWPEAE